MAYSRRTQRLLFIGLGLASAMVAVVLMALAFRDTATFFFTPADLQAATLEPNQRFRIGGLVAEGSVVKDGETTRFDVADGVGRVTVQYTGILPDLFREQQGMVAEGKLNADGIFIADKVLAKHDETYMPREIADRLKEQGVWKGQE